MLVLCVQCEEIAEQALLRNYGFGVEPISWLTVRVKLNYCATTDSGWSLIQPAPCRAIKHIYAYRSIGVRFCLCWLDDHLPFVHRPVKFLAVKMLEGVLVFLDRFQRGICGQRNNSRMADTVDFA